MHLQAKKCQGWLATIRSRKKQGQILPYRFQRECGPAHTLILDFFQGCERIHFCSLSYLVCGTLYDSPLETRIMAEQQQLSQGHAKDL